MMVGMQTLMLWNMRNGQPATLGSGLYFGAMMILILGVIQIGAIWRTRLLVLSGELTRPYTRRALQYEWIAAFALDLIPSAIIAALVAALAMNFVAPLQIRWEGVPWHFAVSAARRLLGGTRNGSDVCGDSADMAGLRADHVINLADADGCATHGNPRRRRTESIQPERNVAPSGCRSTMDRRADSRAARAFLWGDVS